MAEPAQQQTPFGEPATQTVDTQQPEVVEKVVGEPGDANTYKIVRSATGKNYVEANDYDPLGHHRSRDPKENKGQGLGFMFCCCSPKTAEDAEQK